MRFLIDNALSPRFAAALRFAGHDAVHVRDLGMAAAEDGVVFDRAAQEDRIIISEDTDFGTLLATREDSIPSVIILRRRVKSVEALQEILLKNLVDFQADLIHGAIVVIEDSRIRIRGLPI